MSQPLERRNGGQRKKCSQVEPLLGWWGIDEEKKGQHRNREQAKHRPEADTSITKRREQSKEDRKERPGHKTDRELPTRNTSRNANQVAQENLQRHRYHDKEGDQGNEARHGNGACLHATFVPIAPEGTIAGALRPPMIFVAIEAHASSSEIRLCQKIGSFILENSGGLAMIKIETRLYLKEAVGRAGYSPLYQLLTPCSDSA